MKFPLMHKSILWQYGLSFFLVLIIPLMAICSYFVITTNHAVATQSMSDRQKRVSEISTNLTNEFNDIINSAYRLSIASGISRYKMESISKYGQDTIETLRRARLESELIDSVYLYHPQAKYAYSGTTSYTQDRFPAELRHSLAVDKKSSLLFQAAPMLSDFYPSLVVGETSIYLQFPYPVSEPQSDIRLIYEIKQETITKKLKELAGDPNMTIALYTKTGEPIVLYGALNPVNLAKTVSAESGKLYSVREKDGDIYTLYQAELPAVQLRLIMVAPESEIISIVSNSQWQMTLAILIVLICGGTLAFLFTYAAYRPVQQLKSNAEALSNSLQGTEQNEFAAIQAAMESMHTSVSQLESLSSVNQKALRQYLVLRLIYGMIPDDNSLRDTLKHLGIFTEDGYCFVTICYFSNKNDGAAISDALVDCFDGAKFEEVAFCSAVGPELNQVTMVCMSDTEDVSTLQPFLDELRSKFTKRFETEITISVGLAYSSLDYLSTSYIQATSRYVDRSIVEKNDVLFFSAQGVNCSVVVQYRNLLTLLGNAIQNRSQEEIVSSLQFILDFVNRDGITVQSAYVLCYNIIELASTSLYSLKYDRQPEFNQKYNLTRIASVDTIDKLCGFIKEISADICSIAYMDARTQGENDEERLSLQKRLQEYLDVNICNHQFSVAGMASDFSLSTSYVSRIYKEYTNETILEYINRKRIERVKVLLKETDETIDTIVSSVGYFDVSSFIRKFKKMVGVTPGEFRHNKYPPSK